MSDQLQKLSALTGTDPREEKLPVWVKELLVDLRKKVKYGNEPLLKEVANLRPLNQKLKAQNDALKDLLSCAAKGGHLTALDIMNVIEEYAPWKEDTNSEHPG